MKKNDKDIVSIVVIGILIIFTVFSIWAMNEQEKEIERLQIELNQDRDGIFFEKIKQHSLKMCSSGCYATIELKSDNIELLNRWKNDSFLLAQGYTSNCSCLNIEQNTMNQRGVE